MNKENPELRLASNATPSIPRWSFLCVGAGAIGAYIGGSLLLTGQRVVFLVRPATAERLRSFGLRLNLKEAFHEIRSLEIATTLEEALTLGPYDMGIIAVKAFDVPNLAQSLAPYRAALPPVICLQNGVESESILAEALGWEKIIPASLTSAVSRTAGNDIALERLRGLAIAGEHKRIPPLIAILNAAGLKARYLEDPQAMKWSKLLTNLLLNASSAILNMSPAEILAHPGLYVMELKQIREALAIMRAQKIPLINLPGAPVRWMIMAMERLPTFLSRPLLAPFLSRGRGLKMPSLHIDLHQGRGQTEVDYLNGAVVRFGKRLDIPTPVNRVLNETLIAMHAGRIPLETFDHRPQSLLEHVLRAEEEDKI